MKRFYYLILISTIASCFMPSSVSAGPYTDALAKCLVSSTTSTDKSTLVQWMFATFSLHPRLRQVASITDSDRQKLNKQTAKLFDKLLTESCRSQTKEAIKYEGQSSIENGFDVLGQVASRELISDPAVSAGLAEFAKYSDPKRMQELFNSAK
jgi:hypothetical protein